MDFDMDQLIAELARSPEIFAPVSEVLSDIRRLDRRRIHNLGRLLHKFSALQSLVRHGSPEVREHTALREYLETLREELAKAEAHVQRTFGLGLEKELQGRGFSLSGHYPLLKSGLFTLELDFSRYRFTLWYGPRQERLGIYPMVAEAAARKVVRARSALGASMNEDFFRGYLSESYAQACEGDTGATLPIISLITWEPPEPDRLLHKRRKRISRADLSYNLFRYADVLLRHGWRLKVASRSHTRRRSDFLWVPDAESGTGSYYSHITLTR